MEYVSDDALTGSLLMQAAQKQGGRLKRAARVAFHVILSILETLFAGLQKS